MDVQLTDEGELEITDMTPEQAGMVARAAEVSPRGELREDAVLGAWVAAPGPELRALSRDQVSRLAFALRDSPDQSFMEDPELRRLFKLMAVLTSEVFDQMTEGQFDFSQFKLQ